MSAAQRALDRIRYPLIGYFYSLFPGRISTRKILPFYLNKHRLLGCGAEIGVQKGAFSEHLLRYWRGDALYCIDPWLHFNPAEYVERNDNVADEIHEDHYHETVKRLKRFGSRAQIIRAPSKEAALKFENHSLDFVFIDAQHHYEAVKEDIRIWHPKIKSNGLLCGHDWLLDYGPPLFGVKKAVVEFIEQSGLELVISADRGTWFVRLAK